ncbi:MAG TPA: prolyl oligopeptidase family serine peptidase [Fimbriimonadaceae bacterium]|nr:prolyl oligopeptidase family serine peptidase [Fimbriimonadaceae bacterium]
MPLRIRVFALVCLLVFPSLLFSQDLPKPKSGLSIERLYDYPIVNGRSPSAEKMSHDGHYVVYGTNKTGARMVDVYVMDLRTGRETKIVESDKLPRPPRQDDERTDQQKKDEVLYDGGLTGYRWSPDDKEIMAGPYRGRVWLFDVEGKHLRPLIDPNEQASSPQYSPDGKYIAFVRGQNLFRFDRKDGEIKQLTFLSKANTSLDGFDWSPDSSKIMVWWSDSTKLGNGEMMDYTGERAKVVHIQRMWQGEMSQNTQIGVVDADGGLIKFADGLPRYMWPTSTEWSPDSRMLAVYWTKDDFQEATITVIPVETMKKFDAYNEKAPKNYIPDFRTLAWTRDSKRILFTTDIHDGKFVNRGLYSMTIKGEDIQPVFAEDYDIAGFTRPKNSDRIVLVTQARSPLKTEITVLEPSGKRTVHVPIDDGVATSVQFDDCAPPLVSDDGKVMASMVSGPETPWELYSIEPNIKRLTFSPTDDFKKLTWADFKEVTFPGPDGETLHGLLVTPKNMDTTKKHPAFLCNMYANSAKMGWKGYFSNYAAQELDMVSLYVDFAASWGMGGERNSNYYKKMGIIDVEEAKAAKDYLASLPYVNADRCGVWGWSYGGFLTEMIMFTAPGVYDTGVAVAPVTDWSTYNEWYTRRRLGMIKDDPDIYKKTSPLYHPEGLEGNIKMIHGMLDDNVLFQNTVRMIQALIDHDKHFDFMTYPRDDHSIGKATSRPHVFGEIMRYLYWKLSRE